MSSNSVCNRITSSVANQIKALDCRLTLIENTSQSPTPPPLFRAFRSFSFVQRFGRRLLGSGCRVPDCRAGGSREFKEGGIGVYKKPQNHRKKNHPKPQNSKKYSRSTLSPLDIYFANITRRMNSFSHSDLLISNLNEIRTIIFKFFFQRAR